MVQSQGDEMDRKGELMEAAVTVISEKGFAKTRIADIVAQAGVAQGTFYLYFESKEALMVEMAKELIERMQYSFQYDLAGQKTISQKEFIEKLYEIFHGFTGIVRENAQTIRILANEAKNNADLHRFQVMVLGRVSNYLTELLNLGKKSGILRENDYKSIISMALMAILQFFTSTANYEFPMDNAIDEFIDICLYGLLKEKNA